MRTCVEEPIGEVISEENEFPDDLEGRLSSVLNAVNTEFKTVTLLHLDDSPADRTEIKDRIRDTRGRGYLPQESAFGVYGNTLHNIALVARQTVVRDNGETQVLGYSLTEAGKQYGVPVAEHVLKWVVDNNLSMYKILGPTLSGGETRSPSNRVRILEALSTGKASEGELVDFLGLENIQSHLIKLDKIGFVEFHSVGAKTKGFSEYVWVEDKNPGNVRIVRGLVSLTKKIAEEMSKKEEMDSNSLSKILSYKYPTVVSGILSDLERQGFLRRTLPYLAGRFRSRAIILEPGKKFLDEVVYPVKEHLADVAVLETDFKGEFGEYVTRGIYIYAKVSPFKNKALSSERIQQIRSYLLKNPHTTPREIGEFLGLGVQSVGNYLRKIEDLKTEKEGNEVRYFLGDET